MRKAFLSIIYISISYLSQAQNFISKPISGVPVQRDGAIDVGDYDLDGDLDFAVTGEQAYQFQNGAAVGGVGYTGIYKNVNGQFTQVPGLNLLEARLGDIAWGDFDSDGDLDLIVSGSPTGDNTSNTKVLALYRNNGNDSFESMTTTITPFNFGKFKLVDFDKDGLLDIGVTGAIEGQFSNIGFADVYRNNGNFSFQRMNLNIAQVSSSSMAFIDIEKDGDLDIVLNGFTDVFTYQTYFYINNNNSMTLTATVLDNLGGIVMGVHDLNNDGFDDVVLSGIIQQSPYNNGFYIYLNNQGTLQRNVMSFTGVKEGSIDFADFDKDGDTDLLITGGSGPSITPYLTQIVKNDGSSFSVLANQFVGSFRGGAKWGDYDLDGDYDFIEFSATTILYLQCLTITTSVQKEICNGTTYTFGSQVLTQSGTYSKTFTAHNGCDSLVTLTLKVKSPIQSSSSATICSGTTYSFNGVMLSASGTYTKKLVSKTGCDSLAMLILTVTPPIVSPPQSATICSGSTYSFYGTSLSESGTYTKSLKTKAGCDSLVTLILVVTAPIQSSANATICSGSTYSFGGAVLSESGTYTKSFKTKAGCDSLVTLNLVVTAAIQSSVTVKICSGSTYSFGGTVLSDGGTYSKSFKTRAGCDSLVTLTLVVTAPVQSSISATICSGSAYLFDGKELSVGGEYTKTTKTRSGCDSLVTLTLDVTQLNTQVEQEGSHLRAVENNVDYQWYDCVAQKNIAGEDQKIFKVTKDGVYAVTLKKGSCTATSECIKAVSIFQNYPNPADHQVSFKLSQVSKNIEARLFNSSGKMVGQWQFSDVEEFTIMIDSLSNGTYFFEVNADGALTKSTVVIGK